MLRVALLGPLLVAALPVLGDADGCGGATLDPGTPPPVLAAGAQMAVLAGDPSQSGPVTLRLKLPAGYKIAPHWHPTDERVTVISGLFGLGMGDTLDKKKSKVLKPGGYAVAPAKMHHYAWTKSGAIVQVDLMGPFAITYVNSSDDPSKKN